MSCTTEILLEERDAFSGDEHHRYHLNKLSSDKLIRTC